REIVSQRSTAGEVYIHCFPGEPAPHGIDVSRLWAEAPPGRRAIDEDWDESLRHRLPIAENTAPILPSRMGDQRRPDLVLPICSEGVAEHFMLQECGDGSLLIRPLARRPLWGLLLRSRRRWGGRVCIERCSSHLESPPMHERSSLRSIPWSVRALPLRLRAGATWEEH